jgi:predicted Zn-dependent peptidase
VQRVFEEVAFLKAKPLSPGQVALVRDSLLREFEMNSQDNGYLLDQISRRYRDGDGADVAALDHVPAQIAALTGDAIQLAAQTYLNTENYVRVTLMPETK